MVPFLKNKEVASANAEHEPLLRNSDQDFGMLDAIVEDVLEGVHKNNKELLKSALEALIGHIKEEDQEQDESFSNNRGFMP